MVRFLFSVLAFAVLPALNVCAQGGPPGGGGGSPADPWTEYRLESFSGSAISQDLPFHSPNDWHVWLQSSIDIAYDQAKEKVDQEIEDFYDGGADADNARVRWVYWYTTEERHVNLVPEYRTTCHFRGFCYTCRDGDDNPDGTHPNITRTRGNTLTGNLLYEHEDPEVNGLGQTYTGTYEFRSSTELIVAMVNEADEKAQFKKDKLKGSLEHFFETKFGDFIVADETFNANQYDGDRKVTDVVYIDLAETPVEIVAGGYDSIDPATGEYVYTVQYDVSMVVAFWNDTDFPNNGSN